DPQGRSRRPESSTPATVFSPSVAISALRAQPQFPPVFCYGRCPGQEQFPPKQLVRQTSFHVPVRSAKPIHTPDYAAKCFATTLGDRLRSEEHTSELQSLAYLVCRLLLE